MRLLSPQLIPHQKKLRMSLASKGGAVGDGKLGASGGRGTTVGIGEKVGLYDGMSSTKQLTTKQYWSRGHSSLIGQ